MGTFSHLAVLSWNPTPSGMPLCCSHEILPKLEESKPQHAVQGCSPRCCPRTSPFVLFTPSIQAAAGSMRLCTAPLLVPRLCPCLEVQGITRSRTEALQARTKRATLPSISCGKQSSPRGDFRRLPAPRASPAALGSGSRAGPAGPYLAVIHVCRQPRSASPQPLLEEQAEPPARPQPRQTPALTEPQGRPRPQPSPAAMFVYRSAER